MKVKGRPRLQGVVAVPVYRLHPEPATPGNRVLAQALIDGETCVVLGRESDRPATLAWLDGLEVADGVFPGSRMG